MFSADNPPKFYFIQVQEGGTDLDQETSYLDFESGFDVTLDAAGNRARVTVSYTSLGITTPVGNTGKWLRSDGTNWVASTPTLANTATTGTVLRGDGTNWLASSWTIPGSFAQGDLAYASASNVLTALAIGSSGRFLQSSGSVPQWTAPGALTKVDDTNVTLALGGTPASALVTAASITVGWTGTLAAARLNGNVVQAVTNDTNVTGSVATQNLTLGWTGTLAAARLNANVVQSVVNDTNVTGSIATQALTLGWTGTLAVARGGSGAGTLTGYVKGNGTSAFTASSTVPVADVSGVAGTTYTPTLTNIANLTASTPYQCHYMRVASTVFVSGRFDADPTAAGDTQLGISLPVASNFGAAADAGGVAFAPAVAGLGAGIQGDPASDTVIVQWQAVDTANRGFFFTFGYEVI
jgi:hypothetical protein